MQNTRALQVSSNAADDIVRREFYLCERLGGPAVDGRYNRSLDEVWATKNDYTFIRKVHGETLWGNL